MDRSNFCSKIWCVDPRYLLDTSTVDVYFLDTSSIDTSILSILASVEIYWLSYIKPLCDPVLISIDLSLDTSLFLSQKHSNLTPILVLKDFPRFSSFSSLGKLLILLIHAFHVLKPRIWGFWKFLGFFKIDEISLKFWVGFSLKCVQNLIHCTILAL